MEDVGLALGFLSGGFLGIAVRFSGCKPETPLSELDASGLFSRHILSTGPQREVAHSCLAHAPPALRTDQQQRVKDKV